MWQLTIGFVALCITVYGITEVICDYLIEKAKYENKDKTKDE